MILDKIKKSDSLSVYACLKYGLEEVNNFIFLFKAIEEKINQLFFI